jgi:pilus assembly protein CpaE
MRPEGGNSELQKLFASTSEMRIELRSGTLRDFTSACTGPTHPDVLVADIRSDTEEDINWLADVMRKTSRMAVIVTSSDASFSGVRQLMRLGVVDYLPQPIERSDLLGALEMAKSRLQPSGKQSRNEGRVMPFIRSCGGAGATTLAIQAAFSLLEGRRTPRKVCLIDFDLQFGGVMLALDLNAKRNMMDIVQSPERVDGAFLKGVLSRHESGLYVLPAPDRIIPLDAMSADVAAKIITLARQEFDYVVVDLPHAWTAWTARVLSLADAICLVTQLNVPGIHQTRRQLDTLAGQGLGQSPVIVTANRFSKSFRNRGFVKQAEESIGRSIDYFVPNDYRTVSQAINAGTPLSAIKRRNPVEKQVMKMMNATVEMLRQEPLMLEEALVAV